MDDMMNYGGSVPSSARREGMSRTMQNFTKLNSTIQIGANSPTRVDFMDAAANRSPQRNDLDAASQISKAIASVRSTKGRALEKPKVVDKHAWFNSISGT